MAAATASIWELVSQMQENLDAINYHLARISDTKAHDDEIERLENERQRQIDLLNLQWAQDAKELEEKRRQIGLPFEEKRQQDRERIAARRAQEEQELAAARKREDEIILARRKAEDAERQARIQQEEGELKASALKEEEEIQSLLAGEVEQKRLQAAKREDKLHDDIDAEMIKLEDEMEKKVVESTKILAELDEKRKALSAMIDTQMKPARRPTFRRGSKRYSITSIAGDVAAMLTRKTSTDRKSALSQIAERDVESKPISSEIPRDIPTPARSDHTSSRMSFTGSMRSMKSEDEADIKAREEMARINAQLMAEIEAEERGASVKQTQDTRRLIERVVPSNSSIISTKSEDPEDIRAREEMARINAEIMAAAAAEKAAQASPAELVGPRFLEGTKTPDEVASLNAALMEGASKISQRTEVKEPVPPTVTPHQHLPTWANQVELPVVKGSHGVLSFRKGGADMVIVEAPKVVDLPQAKPSHSLTPLVYTGPLHAQLPTWADQATLPIVSGSHGALRFEDNGAKMIVLQPPRETRAVPRPIEMNISFKYDGLKHQLLPTWADQSTLSIITGSWGTLVFREGGADLVIVEDFKEKETIADASNSRSPVSPSIIPHELLPTWANQAKLAVVKGMSGMLSFRDGGADMEPIQSSKSIVLEATWFGKSTANGRCHAANKPQRIIDRDFAALPGHFKTSMPVSPVPKQPEDADQVPDHIKQRFPVMAAKLEAAIEQKRWSTSNGLGNARINRGREKSLPPIVARSEPAIEQMMAKGEMVEAVSEKYDLNHPALGELVQANQSNSYWGADQRHLDTVTGSHGMISFYENGNGAVLTSVSALELNRYWLADQASLKLITGDHGILAFNDTGASTKVFKFDRYWVDQRTLAIITGDYGKLSFEGGACTKVVRSDIYWADQGKLAVIVGDHGVLKFSENGAEINMKKTNPYWADQSELEVVSGSHARLAFSMIGAEMKVVSSDPYWVDQSTLSLIMGSHGRLSFIGNDAFIEVFRIDPYWNCNQARLRTMMGSHACLTFDTSGAEMKIVNGSNIFWSIDQAKLEVRRGDHGMLVFDDSGAAMDAIQLPDSYWGANQARLDVLRGSHGTLRFRDGGASMEADQPSDPYWSANQAKLEVLRGSHGMLNFDDDGVSVELIHLPDAYWGLNQGNLDVLRGVHGMLYFTDNWAFVQGVRPNRPYWMANQGNLEIVRGAHGILQFTDEESVVYACPITEHKQSKLY